MKDPEKEIIDFYRKGHLIRFFLGKNGEQWGDDWDDVPYEHNAGRVYDEFVKSYEDVVVPFEWEISEPSGDYSNSPYSKEDLRDGKVACLSLSKPDGKKIHIMFGDTVPRLI